MDFGLQKPYEAPLWYIKRGVLKEGEKIDRESKQTPGGLRYKIVAHSIWGITCEVVLFRLLKCKTTAVGVVHVVVPFLGYLTLRNYTNELDHLLVNLKSHRDL